MSHDAGRLLARWSLGVLCRDVHGLDEARTLVPRGARIYVGFVDSESAATRKAAIAAVRRAGFVPVPVIPARRMTSEAMLRQLLEALRSLAANGSVLVVGGDPPRPLGPYPDASRVITSGLLEEHGVQEVDVVGHPAGHPTLTSEVLWSTLVDKVAALEDLGLAGNVVTQFAFDADQLFPWLAGLRNRGVDLPVQLGVPGPAPAQRLFSYAATCGVSISGEVAQHYGLSLADPGATVGPDWLLATTVAGYDAQLHGEVRLHVNVFDGIAATARWIDRFCSSLVEEDVCTDAELVDRRSCTPKRAFGSADP